MADIPNTTQNRAEIIATREGLPGRLVLQVLKAAEQLDREIKENASHD